MKVFAVIGLLVCSLVARAQEQADKRIVAEGRRYALIVGVGEAKPPGFSCEPLPACIDDARAVSTALKSAGYQVTTLTEKDPEAPTKTNVMSQLTRVCNGAGESDQVLVYFSSHGGAPGGVPSIALKDALVPLKNVKAELAKSKALVRIILLDACRSETGFRTETSEYRDIHTILSCRPDEKSGFGPSGLSAFTEVLVEALRDCRADRVKDGNIELDELLVYLDDQVPKRAAAATPGRKQNPTRTVVDPRSVNPILTTCNKKPGVIAPIAVRAPVLPATANDLILPAQLVGRATIGMTAAELLASAGAPASPLRLDQDGMGSAVFVNVPGRGDEVRVWLEGGRVSRVQSLRAVECRGRFDEARAREAFERLTKDVPDKETTRPFAGWAAEQVVAQLGCPDGAPALLSPLGSGEIVYHSVPRDGCEVRFKFERGVVSHVSLVRKYQCESSGKDAARAAFRSMVGNLGDLMLPAAFAKTTPMTVVRSMGCPSNTFQIDEMGSGEVVYDDVPGAGDRVTFRYKNDLVFHVAVERVVPCKARGVDAERAAFAGFASGKQDAAAADAMKGLTAADVGDRFGCPTGPFRLDADGMGTATYADVPQAGDELAFVFFKGSVISVRISRRVK